MQIADQAGCHRRHIGKFAQFQRVQNAHRFDGVLVHRKYVISIELHLPNNAGPIWQNAADNAGFVQHREPSGAIGFAIWPLAAQQIEKNLAGFFIAAQIYRPAFVADKCADRQRM